MTKFTKHKWWILTVALTLPAVAIAVPNSFTANTTISAQRMNENFANLEGRVAALEARGVPTLSCFVKTADTGTLWLATCPSDYKMTGGGCDVLDKGSGQGINISFPGDANTWVCDANVNLAGTYAICCKL